MVREQACSIRTREIGRMRRSRSRSRRIIRRRRRELNKEVQTSTKVWRRYDKKFKFLGEAD
jgi:hypothetical protein